ncbi:MAG: YARHG domain-containing protein [Treponema sp.]|nr:YARHG domain-containing protein [Treponema sp.]
MMKNSVLCLLVICELSLFSCNKESPKEVIEVANTEAINVQNNKAMPVLQYQTSGFTAKKSEYSVKISDDFMGVYLPDEYINSLISTRNHSISIHSYGYEIHDVLAVMEDNIYSNGKWHDQYGILEVEGNLFQYVYDGNETVIIDNNGYSYRKIGDDPRDYYTIARTFTAEIILTELESKRIGVFVSTGMVVIPFLYFFTGEDTFRINLDDMFFEEGLNLLLLSATQENQFYMGLLIEGDNYYFYSLKRNDNNRLNERADLIYHYNLAEDKNIILALSGLSDYIIFYYYEYINGLTDYEKRIIINTMYALHGYSFVTEEWQSFFSQYSWYKPDEKVRNDPSILNTYQQKLLEYLSH